MSYSIKGSSGPRNTSLSQYQNHIKQLQNKKAFDELDPFQGRDSEEDRTQETDKTNQKSDEDPGSLVNLILKLVDEIPVVAKEGNVPKLKGLIGELEVSLKKAQKMGIDMTANPKVAAVVSDIPMIIESAKLIAQKRLEAPLKFAKDELLLSNKKDNEPVTEQLDFNKVSIVF
jgi:hypothetical protein